MNLIKIKTKDHNLWPVGLRNTRISTEYAQKSLQTLRATSHTRLSVHEHYTSSALIGGKGGAV